MLCQVYPLTRPGWSIPTVSFSDAAAQTFYRYWDTFKHMPQTAAVRIRASSTLRMAMPGVIFW